MAPPEGSSTVVSARRTFSAGMVRDGEEVVVPPPLLAAEEIDRCAGDHRFVQVLMPVACEMMLGRSYYWPIWEAAARHGLPVGDDQAHRALRLGLDQAQGPGAERQAEELQQLQRDNAANAADAGMGAQVEDRVGFDRWPRCRADRAEDAIDDAPVLHVGGQQAELLLRGFRPGNGFASAERPVLARQQQIGFLVDRL